MRNLPSKVETVKGSCEGKREQPAPCSWSILPAELRLLILECVVESNDTPEHCSLAPLASVCEEWQSFFEKHTFRQLTINQRALPAFERAVAGPNAARLVYVRHVRLHLRLPGYKCPDCAKPESRSTAHKYVIRILTQFENESLIMQ